MIKPLKLSDICLGDCPEIIFHQGYDATLRGDTRGYFGMAQSMEKHMGAHIQHVQYKILNNPRLKGLRGLDHAVTSPKNPSNTDIGFVSPSIEIPEYLKNASKIVHKSNMDCGQKNHGPRLVPHDLTPEKMSMAGQTFRQKMLGFPKNFILVGVSSWKQQNTVDGLIDDVKQEIGLLKEKGPVGVFLINGPRISVKEYDEIFKKIKSECNNATAIKGFNSARHKHVYNGYNPYLGALNECETVIYRGHSFSMESEILYSGKKIIVPLSELETIDPAVYEDRHTTFSENKTVIFGTPDSTPDEAANITHYIAYTIAKEWAAQRLEVLGLNNDYTATDIKELKNPWGQYQPLNS